MSLQAFLGFSLVVAGVAMAVMPAAAGTGDSAQGKDGSTAAGSDDPPPASSAAPVADVLAGDIDHMTALETMARTMWGEDRGGGFEGLSAVANVIKNRAQLGNALRLGFPPEDIKGVCLQLNPGSKTYHQFSCWNVGDPNRVKLLRVDRSDANFVSCLDIAQRVLAGTIADNTSGAQFYFADSMKTPPTWAARMVRTAVIAHQFYYRA